MTYRLAARRVWAQPNLSTTLDALSGLPLVLVFEAERHDT
jgi:hypothetical protein